MEPDDLIYVNPPYDVEFTSYSQEDFKWDDQVRLAEWLDKHKCTVILSNQATDRIIRLYRSLGFLLCFLDAQRMISRNGDRTKAKEILALKNV